MNQHDDNKDNQPRWQIVRSIDRRQVFTVLIAILMLSVAGVSASGHLAVGGEHNSTTELQEGTVINGSVSDGAVQLLRYGQVTNSFEDQPADSGIPDGWEYTSNGDNALEVTTADAYSGSQSLRFTGSGTTFIRPTEQPYTNSKTKSVSAAIKTTNNGGDIFNKHSLAVRENDQAIMSVAVTDPDRDGDAELSYYNGGWNILSDFDYTNTWVKPTIKDINPESNTVSISWTSSLDSGISTSISTTNAMSGGYDETELRATGGSEGYFDDVNFVSVADAAQYTSGNLTVSNAELATANLTTVTNADATISAEYWTGNQWNTANETTVTSEDNHEVIIPSVESSTWRVKVSAESTGTGSEVVVNDDAILFADQDPEFSNPDPSLGSTVQESPVELSINVSDADFDTSQGDSVNVTFYDASDDSQIGSQTLTSNGTATTSWGDVVGGQNVWYAVATDSYGNTIQSQTFTFNAPNELEIRALDTQELITQDANGDPLNVEVQFFGGEGAVATRNTTDGTISMTGLPVDQRFAVNVDAGDSYVSRQILITSLVEHQTAYLLNNSASVETVSPRFVLEDPSNQFDTEESEIILERPIEVNGTTEFVPVAGDRIGLNGFDTTLEKGQRYRVTVRDPTSGAERRLGEFTPTVSEQVTLTVQDVEFDSVSDVDGIDWTARYLANEDSADQIEFLYRDADTSAIDYQIYERGNQSNELTSGSATGNVTATETVPAGEESTVWVVEWEATLDNGETISGTRQVSSGQLPVGPGLAPEWQTALSMVGLFVVAGLFGAANPAIGGIAVATTGGFFWMLGWLPDGTSGLMVLLALFIAVLSYGARKARGTTA